MFKRIFLQRRRLAVWAFCMLLTFPMFSLNNLTPFSAWWFYPLTALVAACITTPFIALFIALMPRKRTMVEVLAITMTLLTLTAPLVAQLGMPPLRLILPIPSLFVVSWLLYGRWTDSRGWRVKSSATYSFTSHLSAQDIWPALAPGLGATKDYHAGLVKEISADSDDEDTFNVRYALGRSRFEDQQITFLNKTPNKHVKYYFMGNISDKTRNFAEGTWDAVLSPVPKGTKVTITETHCAMPPRIGLLYWMDNSLGDKASSIKAQVEKRYDWSMFGLFARDAVKSM